MFSTSVDFRQRNPTNSHMMILGWTCVHRQEPHNLIKSGGVQRCPWCQIDELSQRLRKAESLIAEQLASWETVGYGYFREQQLRMAMYKPFLDAKPPD